MRFQTKPVETDAYRVGSEEGRTTLQHHQSAFESKNLWDCWEIRTPRDQMELVTKDDWIAVDQDNRIYPISQEDLTENYIAVGPITNCLQCGNPTGYSGIAALPLRDTIPLCLNCKTSKFPQEKDE